MRYSWGDNKAYIARFARAFFAEKQFVPLLLSSDTGHLLNMMATIPESHLVNLNFCAAIVRLQPCALHYLGQKRRRNNVLRQRASLAAWTPVHARGLTGQALRDAA